MKNYIKNSSNKALHERKEYTLSQGSVPIIIINKLPNNLNFNKVIKLLEKNIPSSLLNLVDGIYVGDFKELEERNIDAMFKDGVIYLSSFKIRNAVQP